MKKRLLILLSGIVLLTSCQGEKKVYREYCPNFGYLNCEYSDYVPCLIDDNNIVTNSTILTPFNTYVEYVNHIYESELSETQKNIDNVNRFIIHLSMCFDRHNLYVNKNNELLKNLAYLNMNYGCSEFIELEKETYDLLKIGYELAKLTDGKFNMAIGELSSLWDNFIKDVTGKIAFPSEEEISLAVNQIPTLEEYDELFVFNDENHSVKFNAIENKKISITFGGIAKGRATDLLNEFFSEKRIIVSAGQSSIASYGDSFSETWNLGIRNPLYPLSDDVYLLLKRQGAFSLSTSGDYQNFRIYEGERYHHIINPFTGYPNSYHRSVSLLGSNGVYADALTTALMLMEKEEGQFLLNKIKSEKGYEFYPIYIDEEVKGESSVIKAYATSSLSDSISLNENSGMELVFF